MNQQEQQELMMKISMFEQQAQNVQQQLQSIEQSKNDLSLLSAGLEDIKGSKGKEIIAPMGRGIFVNAKLLSEELTVDIGNNNLVKKTIPETKKIIEKQIKKLEDAKEELNMVLEKISVELQKTFEEAQKKQVEKKE